MKTTITTLIGSALGISSLLLTSPAHAASFGGTTELMDDFLIIGLGNADKVDEAVQVSGGGSGSINAFNETSQLGADTQFLSHEGGLNNFDVFNERFTFNNGNNIQKNRGWVENDHNNNDNDLGLEGTETVRGLNGGIQAADLGVGIDYSGEIAVTSDTGRIAFSNVNLFADTGIQCASSSRACAESQSDGNYVYLDPTQDTVGDLKASGQQLGSDNNTNGVIGGVDMNPLLEELNAFESFVRNANSDFTITSNFLENNTGSGDSDGFNNQNIKDGSDNPFIVDVDVAGGGGVRSGFGGKKGPVIFDLGDTDATGKRYDSYDEMQYVFIDVDLDGTFKLTNTELIVNGSSNVTAVFRLLNGTNLEANQSSILLGDGGIGKSDPNQSFIDNMGALFIAVDEEHDSGDAVLSFNDTVLNGVGLYDLTSFRDHDPGDKGVEEGKNVINIQNGQGCAQFIGSKVQMSNVRWNKCSLLAQGNEDPYTPEQEIPEPGTAAALGLLAAGMVAMKRRASK